MPAPLFEFRVWTFIAYPPDPRTDVEKRGYNCIRQLKRGGSGFSKSESMIESVARRIRETAFHSVLEEAFSLGTVLVPAPKSSLLKPGQFWATAELCRALHAEHVAIRWEPLLRRTRPVPSSAGVARAANRPSARLHAETIEASTRLVGEAPSLLIVDDVLTKGATMMGCAVALRAAYPDAKIKGFAVGRTNRKTSHLASPIDPRRFIVYPEDADNSNVRADDRPRR